MKRFQTSKYRNAAPKIPKKEVNVKDFVIFPFKTTIFPLYIRRGTLGGTQYRNTVRKNGKYRNTASQID